MKYSEEFIQLIDETENGEFIGFGNPNSKILFVGKECGLDLTNQVDKFVYEKSNKPNWEHWSQNIKDTPITPESIPVWKDSNEYNPLFPYKGDSLPACNGTWNNYSKIVSQLFSEMVTESSPFHQFSFLTELNDLVMKFSTHSEEVQNAINRRCANLLSKPFFRQFPIVIVGCGHYVPEYNVNLEEVFDQKWDGSTISVGKNEWINVHRNGNRILIHTRQLSMCSNKLIEEIVALCRQYI